MKITRHKRNNELSIRLTNQEVRWLKCILARYNSGHGTMAKGDPNGFPLELYEAITNKQSTNAKNLTRD